MKKYSSLFFLLVITLFLACRKEEDREIPVGYQLFTSDCTNGIQDGDETGVDCGGSCTPCITVDLSCGPVQGNISIDGTSYTIDNVSALSSGFSLQFSQGLIVFQFETTPSTGIYQTTAYNADYSGNRCGIQANFINDVGAVTIYNSVVDGGNIQVTTGANNYSVQFCGVELRNDAGDSREIALSVLIPN